MADPHKLSWDEMLQMPVEELIERSRVPLRIFDEAGELFEYLARYTADLIRDSASRPTPLRIAWPVGPKKHLPRLVEICNDEQIAWHNTINVQVDMWLDWQGRTLPDDHPFDLKNYLRQHLFDRLDSSLRPQEEQLIWHDPLHIGRMDEKLDEIGGLDIVFGGFGFSGHLAYNEPPTSRWYKVSPEEFCAARTHIVPTNEETFLMYAHRSAGGNTRIVPPMGVTLGMKDLLGADKIRLVSDGGSWKQTIFRILCLHEPTVDYPVTFVQGHPDVEVIVDAVTAAPVPYHFAG